MLYLAIAFASLSAAADTSPRVQIHVDSARREVVLSLPGLTVAPAAYDDMREIRAYFEWPLAGWLRGFRIDVFDADGRPLPRAMLHHGGVVNFSRRQLAYQMVERLFAAGQETKPVQLPESYGVPVPEGSTLGMYVALVNPSDSTLKGVTVRMTARWTPASGARPRELLPVAFGANPDFEYERSFDIPPGRSITSAEFTVPVSGWLRGLGAHAHDYASELRLEDVATGKTLVRLKAKRDRNGKLLGIASTKFPLKRHGLGLKADRRYRVVAVYDNPTADTLKRGAMAFLGGVFMARDASQWPVLDLGNERLRADIEALRGSGSSGHHHR